MQIIFESKTNSRANGGVSISARQTINSHDDVSNIKPRYKWHTTARDYTMDNTDNHRYAVILACRVQMQKDPVAIVWGGETKDRKLWIVTVSDDPQLPCVHCGLPIDWHIHEEELGMCLECSNKYWTHEDEEN